MSFFIVCMIMRSHNLLSFNLGIGDWRFSITRLEAKRFQINMSVMHTTICRTALRQTANAICTHKFKMIFPIFQENP